MKSTENLVLLAADIGATKTNMALFNHNASGFSILHEQTYLTGDFDDPLKMILAFLPPNTLPDRVCLAAAGPVMNGTVEFTNLNLEFNARSISGSLNNIPVFLINDLEATAYGLSVLNDDDLALLPTGGKVNTGNRAIIAPGTGLGEAGSYWDGLSYHPFSTEGGHCDFAPQLPIDYELFKFLQTDLKLAHVSWERVLSGAGIYNIFRFLTGTKQSDTLKEQLLTQDPAAVISEHANDHPVCGETLEMFFRYLALEAANLSLKVKATGGLFIAGGIITKNRHLLDTDLFSRHFSSKGRLAPLMKEIPIAIVLNDKAPLLGAAFYAAHNRETA